MRKNIFFRLLLIAFVTFFSHSAYAVKAYPGPIRVEQPDGSVITIFKHGDEFLNWTTSGNRLVKQGPDGFYYLAEFNAEGTVVATGTRVGEELLLQDASTITPPAVALERARRLREEFARNFSVRTDVSLLQRDLLPGVKGPARSIAMGQKRFLVILVQFKDLYFAIESPENMFFNLLNQNGYSANDATGSVRDYFYENSSGMFDPLFDVIGPVTLSNEVAYYGANKADGENDFNRAREMVVEAVRLADNELGVDFSQYDNDGDGVIDNIFIYFAGYNEAEGGPDHTIWPHAWTTGDKSIIVDGVQTNSYACTSELRGASGSTMAGIGTYCHEFGHVIGLPDFYDTDGIENGEARGLGPFSLMSEGNYNHAGRTPPYLTTVERILVGWRQNEIQEFDNEGEYRLDPVSGNHAFAVPTSNDNEFFIYEYRQRTGWDMFIPSSGLLIFHIDMSENIVGGMTAAKRWQNGDGINAYASHQCCDLIEAVYPESSITHNNQVPFPGKTNNRFFTDTSSPAAKDHKGNFIGIYLADIADHGTHATFTVTKSSNLVIIGTVADKNGNPIEGATVTLTHQVAEPSSASAVSQGKDMIALGKVMHTSPQKAEPVAVIVTDENGAYYFSVGVKEGTYIITAEKDGYHPAVKQTNASRPGTVKIDITMYSEEDPVCLLRKHKDWNGGSAGFGTAGGPVYGAVGFSPEELIPYKGKKIESVSFQINGTSAAEVGVFITFDQEIVLCEPVQNPVFGSMMTVNVNKRGLVIPSGKLVKFGCYVKDSDWGYPLAIDDGPMAPLGGYAGESIEQLISPWSINCNVLISATLSEKSLQELKIRGRVTDQDGMPIEGATVILSHEDIQSDPPGKTPVTIHGPVLLKKSVRQAASDAMTAITDNDGQYVFVTQSREGIYNLQAVKEGYNPAYRQTDASATGEVIVDFTLTRIEEGPYDGILKKHGPWEGYAIGYGSPGGTIFGAVGFSAQELAPYIGQTVHSMSFLVNGTQASEVGIFICFGNECVFSGILNNPFFGVMMILDLSQFGIMIPSGQDVKFGYYVKDSDSGYPLATDNGPMAPMGGYAGNSIESLNTTWKEAFGLDVNIQISAIVGGEDDLLFSLGYYMIRYDQREYLAGDTFTLRLNDSPAVQHIERPLAIQWFFNDQEHQTGDIITLTPGDHTVRAILTFNGYKQTIVQEIRVGTAQE